MPSPADLYYISSDACSEMMNIIAEMEDREVERDNPTGRLFQRPTRQIG